jgi:hypothetical protein
MGAVLEIRPGGGRSTGGRNQELFRLIAAALAPIELDLDSRRDRRVYAAYVAARVAQEPDVALERRLDALRGELGLDEPHAGSEDSPVSALTGLLGKVLDAAESDPSIRRLLAGLSNDAATPAG